MRKVFTIWFLTWCLIATSGQRQERPPAKERLPDSTTTFINKLADKAVKDSAWIIDSIIGRIEPLQVHIIQDTPVTRGRWHQIIWYYKIRGRDTLFLYPRIKPI